MGSVKVKMNSKGIEALLSDHAVTADLESRGRRIKAAADAAGSAEYDMAVRRGRKGGRPYVVVAANSPKARASNAKHNTLLKSMDAGRG